MTDYAKPGDIPLPLTPEYDEEFGLGGFHIESCELDGLEEGEELVAPFDRIEVVVSYPLGKPFRFRFERKGGFTRAQLVETICTMYRDVYRAEAKKQATAPGLVDAPDNRPPFGIFGHDLADLILEGITHQGDGKYRLEVGS
jgi:hypothetical protein